MDEYFALFPFTRAASECVRSLDFSVEDLLTGEDFSTEVLTRSSQRIKQALEGEIGQVDLNEDIKVKTELFSYPVARVMVSCINVHFLTQKYANGEAQFAFRKLESLSDDEAIIVIGRLLEDFNIEATPSENRYKFHFTDFVRFTSGLRDSRWKLVNVMNKGSVELAKKEVMKILQQAIRLKVLNGPPLKPSNKICNSLSSDIKSIIATLDSSMSKSGDFGAIDTEAYPPCIRELISLVLSGKSLSHTARFALTAFLANIGMSAEDIVHFYENSPDFDFEFTRYQVEHIMGSSGTEYTSPGCSTMETYGNCNSKDKMCTSISHPLSYYRKRSARKRSLTKSAGNYTDVTV
jgi:DNA primase large subunit